MQKTAYELRISDWSSDVCSSDLHALFSLPGVYCTDRSVCSLHHDSVGQWVVCDTHGQALASAPNVVLANAWHAAGLLSGVAGIPALPKVSAMSRLGGQVSNLTASKPGGLRALVAGEGYCLPAEARKGCG